MSLLSIHECGAAALPMNRWDRGNQYDSVPDGVESVSCRWNDHPVSFLEERSTVFNSEYDSAVEHLQCGGVGAGVILQSFHVHESDDGLPQSTVGAADQGPGCAAGAHGAAGGVEHEAGKVLKIRNGG